MNWPLLIFAGLLGGLVMSLVGLVPRMAGMPPVDLGQVAATKVLRMHVERVTPLAVGLHFLFGVVFALLYGALFVRWLPGPPWLSGLLYGLGLWLVVMLGVLPLTAEGLFGLRGGLRMPLTTLVMHLAYGAIVGGTYGG